MGHIVPDLNLEFGGRYGGRCVSEGFLLEVPAQGVGGPWEVVTIHSRDRDPCLERWTYCRRLSTGYVQGA